MVRSILFILFFIISLLGISLTFLASLAPLKEGIGTENLPYLLSLSAIFLVIMMCWWLIYRRTTSYHVQTISRFCMLFAFIPFALVLFMMASVVYKNVAGKQQSGAAKIDQYRETFINWPGFAYPVGLQITIVLQAPYAKGNYAGFYPPLVWMGPEAIDIASKSAVYEVYFGPSAGIKINGRLLSVLKGIVLSKEKQPSLIISAQESTLTFNLYPGVIEYLESPNNFCTYSGTSAAKDIYSNWPRPDTQSIDKQLSAIWFYAGNIDVMLSAPLTAAMRQFSKLENNPQLWANIHTQFNDDSLLKMGFHPCTLANRTHCFCK